METITRRELRRRIGSRKTRRAGTKVAKPFKKRPRVQMAEYLASHELRLR